MRLPWQAPRPPLDERVARALARGGIAVDDLTITAKRGRITLRGPVSDPRLRLRAVELAEAVAGVKDVDDRLAVVEPVVEPRERDASEQRRQVYIAQAGDTLPSVALRLYGDARRWRELLRLNERVVSDPQVLQPGLRLRLPRD